MATESFVRELKGTAKFVGVISAILAALALVAWALL